MTLTWTDLPDTCRKIDLAGRLDIDGVATIDLKLTTLTSSGQVFAIIDLAGVDFLASIGIGILVRNARAASQRGGRVVLLNPQPQVASVLAVTRIDQMIAVCYSLAEACVLVREPSASPL